MVAYPKDWGQVKLNKIFTPYGGLSGKSKDDFGSGSSIYISYLDVFSNICITKPASKVNITLGENQNIVEHGDLLFTQSSETLDEVGMVSTYLGYEKVYLNSFCFGAKPREKVNSLFFSYYLRSKNIRGAIVIQGQGSTRYNISPTRLLSIELAVPPLDEQEAIAGTISTFDEHIENLTKLIEKKKAIRDGALVDLVTGKTRLDEFEDEWQDVNFNDVIVPKARIGWQGLKKDEYLPKGPCYLIGGTDFDNGKVSLENVSYVSEQRYEMDSNIQVSAGDVLVTKDGTIGKVAIVPEIDKPATLNSGVFVFRTKRDLNPSYLYWVLMSSVFIKFIEELSAGSTIKHLYQKDLKKFSFSLPTDIAEQQAIASVLTVMDEEINSLEQEKNKIIQLRDGAMDDLLTGKIRLV